MQSKFQRNANKISTLAFAMFFVCLRLFFAQKSILHIFCFYVYAQYTNRKPCVSKVMQSKFQRDANKISTLAFALLLCLLALFCTKTCFANCFFLFGCHAVVANCAFARYCQTFVAFITSARYCVGILRFSHCILLFYNTTNPIFVFAFVFNLSTAKNCVCSFLCFSKHLCVAKTFCVLFGIGQNLSAGKGLFCNVLHLLNTTCKENLTSS